MSKRLASALLAAVLCVAGQPAFAQTAAINPPSAPAASVGQSAGITPSVFQDLVGSTVTDFKHLGSLDTLAWMAVGTLAAGATHKFDASVTSEMAGNGIARNFQSGNIVGGAQFQFGTALAAYGIGRVSGERRVSDVAGKVFRAQLVATAITGVVKQTAQRTRPDGADQRSFPSGHTSVSFASATVLQRELGWKVGIPAYAVATSVAAARIEKKKHYLSDVAFGAAIGIVSGHTVTIGSGEKKFAVAPAAEPGGASVNFIWVGGR